MLDTTFTLCFLRKRSPLRSEWMCIHNFPTVQATEKYLDRHHHQDGVRGEETRLIPTNVCMPEFFKKWFVQKKLSTYIYVEHCYNDDYDSN